MNKFKSFTPEGFMLLELNKFNDSKDFYDSVKDDLKKLVIEPMRSIASDVSDELFIIDDKMNLVPTKMVSRIRRDTRFSKNKELYRQNVWCMFMRDKHQWNYQPCMWFEVCPGSYNYGVGMFRSDSAYLECFRNVVSEHQKELIDAVKMAEITNGTFKILSYKKDKPGAENIDNSIRGLYNCKNFWFSYESNDVSKLYDGSIVEELIYAIRAFAHLYKFLLMVTEKMYEKGDFIE